MSVSFNKTKEENTQTNRASASSVREVGLVASIAVKSHPSRYQPGAETWPPPRVVVVGTNKVVIPR